jgi:hypothetical protein
MFLVREISEEDMINWVKEYIEEAQRIEKFYVSKLNEYT